jgi:hypothetical protein
MSADMAITVLCIGNCIIGWLIGFHTGKRRGHDERIVEEKQMRSEAAKVGAENRRRNKLER